MNKLENMAIIEYSDAKGLSVFIDKLPEEEKRLIVLRMKLDKMYQSIRCKTKNNEYTDLSDKEWFNTIIEDGKLDELELSDTDLIDLINLNSELLGAISNSIYNQIITVIVAKKETISLEDGEKLLRDRLTRSSEVLQLYENNKRLCDLARMRSLSISISFMIALATALGQNDFFGSLAENHRRLTKFQKVL